MWRCKIQLHTFTIPSEQNGQNRGQKTWTEHQKAHCMGHESFQRLVDVWHIIFCRGLWCRWLKPSVEVISMHCCGAHLANPIPLRVILHSVVDCFNDKLKIMQKPEFKRSNNVFKSVIKNFVRHQPASSSHFQDGVVWHAVTFIQKGREGNQDLTQASFVLRKDEYRHEFYTLAWCWKTTKTLKIHANIITADAYFLSRATQTARLQDLKNICHTVHLM